jgi:hypothetical protein
LDRGDERLVRAEERTDARHVEHARETQLQRTVHDVFDAARVRLQHLARPGGVERHQRGGVHDRVAARQRPPHRGGVADVSDAVIGDGEPARPEDPLELRGITDEQAHLVAGREQRDRRVGADESGSARDQDPHPKNLATSSSAGIARRRPSTAISARVESGPASSARERTAASVSS